MADTQRANDSVLPQSSGQTIVKPQYVDNTDTFQDSNRISQQRMLPNSLANRLFSQLVSFSDTVSLPLVITNGTSSTINATIMDNDNRIILAIPQVSIYIGIDNIGDISNLNQWPTQAVGGGNFPVYFNPFDYGHVSSPDQVSRVTCRNNTGSDQQILAVIQWKILTVPQATPTNASS